MNGKQIKEIKEQVCEEMNKMEFRYDTVSVYADIESKDLTMAGLSECLKDLDEHENASVGDYEIVITNIRVKFVKK